MNSKNITPLNQDMCMCCLKEKATHKYYIMGRGYGSMFDNEDTHWQCCDKCHKEEYELWTNETPIVEDDYYEEKYTYEENILNFIHNLPLESQELFFNTFSSDGHNIDAQDWIDYQLGQLPHDKCKEYNLYSPEERIAYQERFPTCAEVYKNIWSDGSSGCHCFRGANGNSDGTCDEFNISSKCYMCEHYKLREDSMKVINEVEEFYKNEKSRLENMIKYATARLEELEVDRIAYIEKYECED